MKLVTLNSSLLDFYNVDKPVDVEKVLCETEERFYVGQLLSVNGRTYTVSGVREDYAVGREIYITPHKEVAYTSDLTCPFCAYRDNNSWEIDEDDGEQTCKRCGGVFSFTRNVEVTYCSSPVKPPVIDVIESNTP